VFFINKNALQKKRGIWKEQGTKTRNQNSPALSSRMAHRLIQTRQRICARKPLYNQKKEELPSLLPIALATSRRVAVVAGPRRSHPKVDHDGARRMT